MKRKSRPSRIVKSVARLQGGYRRRAPAPPEKPQNREPHDPAIAAKVKIALLRKF